MGNLPTGNKYEITMSGYGARIFKRCVDHELERWPGGDPNEQIYLMKLQTVINAIVLEDTFKGDWFKWNTHKPRVKADPGSRKNRYV